MIELNAQQRQPAQGEAVRIIDPVTHDAYVLVRAEVDARLDAVRRRPAEPTDAGIQPLMLRSQQAFWRDLPELLKDERNRRKWAAYHGDERVAVSRSDVEAYHTCLARGLERGEFYGGRLEADPDGVPPWDVLEAGWSLFEVTDEPSPKPT